MASGCHALVGRLPALGPPDVQKMRIVQKESLAHLVDVLVFSSKGPRSQASKMQGGDYDGDTFWTCWEPSLVEHFRNVPVRFTESKPTDFGIQTNTETLDHIIKPDARGRAYEGDILTLISKGTQARMRYDQLGTITLALEKLTYDEGGFDSEGAGVLFQVHGHMIDSDKQGYTLPQQKWDRMKLRYKIDSKPTPAYRRLMQGEPIESLKLKAGNIVDHVFFEVVAPAIQHAKNVAEANTKYALARDRDLDPDFPAKLATYEGRAGHGELLALLPKVEDLKLKWKAYMDEYRGKPYGKGEAWRQCVERIREDFDSITPEDADSEPAYSWLNSRILDLSQWDLIKASALVHQKASPKLMFSAAGAELCAIKKNAKGSVRSMTGNAYMWHKPKGVKKKTDVDAEIDGEDAEMTGAVGSG